MQIDELNRIPKKIDPLPSLPFPSLPVLALLLPSQQPLRMPRRARSEDVCFEDGVLESSGGHPKPFLERDVLVVSGSWACRVIGSVESVVDGSVESNGGKERNGGGRLE